MSPSAPVVGEFSVEWIEAELSNRRGDPYHDYSDAAICAALITEMTTLWMPDTQLRQDWLLHSFGSCYPLNS